MGFHGFSMFSQEGCLNQLKLLRYWGALQEAWDGPALVAFCDGEYMGALEMVGDGAGLGLGERLDLMHLDPRGMSVTRFGDFGVEFGETWSGFKPEGSRRHGVCCYHAHCPNPIEFT